MVLARESNVKWGEMIEVYNNSGGSQLGLVRHYRKEFLLIDLSVLVKVKFIDHCLSVARGIRKWGGRDQKC